jgi:hypothetical protein
MELPIKSAAGFAVADPLWPLSSPRPRISSFTRRLIRIGPQGLFRHTSLQEPGESVDEAQIWAAPRIR